MSAVSLTNLLLLSVGLGLLGFIEPCSMGVNLLFIKYLEGKAAMRKWTQTVIFMLTRGLFIGVLGALAAVVGSSFVTAQKGLWILLGSAYLVLGILYLAGRAGFLMRTLGPGLHRLGGTRGPIALGLLFGLNIPACAAPLLFALFGAAAVGGVTVAQGFGSLALFACSCRRRSPSRWRGHRASGCSTASPACRAASHGGPGPSSWHSDCGPSISACS